jgi:hypothetical protein
MEKKTVKKEENLKSVKIKAKNLHMYILLTQTRIVTHVLHDRPILSTGRMPHDKQNHNCLDYNQNLVMSPGGSDAK